MNESQFTPARPADLPQHRSACHLCSGQFHPEPVLSINRMPRGAQYFPSPGDFENDTGMTLEIHQCSACGLVQLSAPPVDYFRMVITATSFSEATRRTRLAQMNEFVKKFGLQGKSALDIGSNKGDMLDIMKEVGLEAAGLEASAESVEQGKKLGRNIRQGYIGEIRDDEIPKPHAFVILNYLEHLPYPGSVIRKIYSITAPNAAGYITVPNLEYLIKSNCLYEFVADHLSYFTRETLARAFASNGFDVLECYLINQENDIAAMVRKRPTLQLSKQFAEVENLADSLRKLVDSYSREKRKVAVWGAGHRTLALMSIADVRQVSYVVDSAPFKHGKFTPVLHFPIVPPINLVTHPVDLVIVMVPGLYPDEVLNTIKDMNIDADIAILRDNRLELCRQKTV